MKTILAAALLLWLLVPPPVLAQTVATLGEKSIGTACNNGADAVNFDTIAQCSATSGSGTFQKAPLFVGQVTSPPYATTACDSAKKGMIQWTGTAFQGCNGTSWQTIGGGSGSGETFMGYSFTTGSCSSSWNCQPVCPAGQYVVSGGCYTANSTVPLAYSAPSGPTSWFCGSQNYTATTWQWALLCTSGNASNSYLGPTATAANPSRNDDLTTGIFSATASTVSIATGGVERLRVTATGSVGIGTTSPAYKLDINNPSGNLRTGLHLGNGGTDDLFLTDNSSVISSNAFWNGGWYYNSSSAATYISLANGAFAFATAPSGTAGATPAFTAKMYISNTGDVGIGTTSPGGKLHIAGTNDGSYFMVGANEDVYIRQGKNGGNVYVGGNLAGNVLLAATTGNVGIGTTSPSERLDLGGGNIKMGYEYKYCNFAAAASGWLSCACPSGKRVLGASCRNTTSGSPLGFDLIDFTNGLADTGASCLKTGTAEPAFMVITCANIR